MFPVTDDPRTFQFPSPDIRKPGRYLIQMSAERLTRAMGVAWEDLTHIRVFSANEERRSYSHYTVGSECIVVARGAARVTATDYEGAVLLSANPTVSAAGCLALASSSYLIEPLTTDTTVLIWSADQEAVVDSSVRRIDPTWVVNQMETPWAKITSPYVVGFAEARAAGNHFHKTKTELILVVRDSALVTLVDPESERSVATELFADDPETRGVLIPPGIAHAVEPVGDETVLLVFATGPAREPEDDFPHEVISTD